MRAAGIRDVCGRDACGDRLHVAERAAVAGLKVQARAVAAEVMQKAVAARDAQAPALLAHPEVQAVGVGASYDNAEEPAIVFFVTKGRRAERFRRKWMGYGRGLWKAICLRGAGQFRRRKRLQ